jgi:hypothetical protein
LKEQGSVRIPKDVLEELESVRRYVGGVEVLDVPTLRSVAMETHKSALTL